MDDLEIVGGDVGLGTRAVGPRAMLLTPVSQNQRAGQAGFSGCLVQTCAP